MLINKSWQTELHCKYNLQSLRRHLTVVLKSAHGISSSVWGLHSVTEGEGNRGGGKRIVIIFLWASVNSAPFLLRRRVGQRIPSSITATHAFQMSESTSHFVFIYFSPPVERTRTFLLLLHAEKSEPLFPERRLQERQQWCPRLTQVKKCLHAKLCKVLLDTRVWNSLNWALKSTRMEEGIIY